MSIEPTRRITAPELRARKGKEPIVALTSYHAHTARILAAADVFDALTAPRYYKPAYPLEKTLEIMDGMSGDHLDPKVMAAVHAARPHLEAAVVALQPTWPKPGDEGMGTIQEAAGLSERDRAAERAGSS